MANALTIQPSPFNKAVRRFARTGYDPFEIPAQVGQLTSEVVGRDAIGRDGDATRVGQEPGDLRPATAGEQALTTALMVASIVAAPLAAYHGYKRNDSVGWAIVWGLLGGLFPVITIPVALAQGFGKPRAGL